MGGSSLVTIFGADFVALTEPDERGRSPDGENVPVFGALIVEVDDLFDLSDFRERSGVAVEPFWRSGALHCICFPCATLLRWSLRSAMLALAKKLNRRLQS